MKDKLDIYTHHYFPYYFIILGIVLIPLIIIPVYPWLSAIFFILSFLFITTHYRLIIDLRQKKYKEALWIFGIKTGREIILPHIEDIYINKTTRDEEYGLVARMHTHKTVFMGFVKLSNGETLFCGENQKEHKLMKKIKMIADVLQTNIRINY